MEQAAQGVFTNITLPDTVEHASAQFDRGSVPNALCDIIQDTVAEVHGVVQTEHQRFCPVFLGVIGKHPLPSQTGLAIFAVGSRCICL